MLKQQQVLRELSEQSGQSQIIGEMDGSMVPLVAVKENVNGDRRKTRIVGWQEARLALARVPGSVTARFGATMGSANQTGSRKDDLTATTQPMFIQPTSQAKIVLTTLP